MRRAGVLAAGAAAIALLVRPGPLPFTWTPLLLGAVYLGIGALGGRRDGYWSAALVVTCWGATVVAISELELSVRTGGAYMVAVGLAALAAGALQRRGVAVSLTGVGMATVAAGLFYALDRYWAGVLGKGRTYAGLLVLWSVLELVQAYRHAGSARGAAEPVAS